MGIHIAPSVETNINIHTNSIQSHQTLPRRERELATLDEQSTSSEIAEPYVRYKLKARTGEEKGWHLWPRLVQKLESESVQKKKKKKNTAP